MTGHFPAPYQYGIEPTANPAQWPPIPKGHERIPNNPWGLTQPTNPAWADRYQAHMTEIIEREYLPISPANQQPEGEPGAWLQPFQVRILNHCFTPRLCSDGLYRFPYHTIIYSDLKKSGKTGMGGAISYGWSRLVGGELYQLANSKKHSADRAYNRMFMFLSYLERTNPARYHKEVKSRGLERMESTEKTEDLPYWRMEALPVSAGSSAGGFQSLTVWDELWSYEHDEAVRLFSEMQPISTLPPAQIMHEGAPVSVQSPSLRLIVTYAGYHGVSELLWQLYEQTVKPDGDTLTPTGIKADGLEDLPCYVSDDGGVFAYWNQDTPRMPWQIPAYFEQARNDPINRLRPEEYARLHRNQWTSAHGAFLDMAQYDECANIGEALHLANRIDWTPAGSHIEMARHEITRNRHR